MNSECFKPLDYGLTHMEEFIQACSGQVDWRPHFILGVQAVIIIVAFIFVCYALIKRYNV